MNQNVFSDFKSNFQLYSFIPILEMFNRNNNKNLEHQRIIMLMSTLTTFSILIFNIFYLLNSYFHKIQTKKLKKQNH